MGRAQVRDTVMLRSPNGILSLAPAGSRADLYDVGTSTPISDTIYAHAVGVVTLPNPVPIDNSNAELEFWLGDERELDVVVRSTGFEPVRVTVTADSAHPTVADPYPQYLTQAEGDARYDASGAAATGDAAHLAASDPHPVYLTQAEADARYALASAVSGVDSELRAYIQQIMAVIDPGGPPAPPP